MPVYEFSCSECGHTFDKYVRIGQRASIRCPECGGSSKKVFRPVGIIFKGSGFYCTDNRDTKEQKPEEGAKAKTGSSKDSD